MFSLLGILSLPSENRGLSSQRMMTITKDKHGLSLLLSNKCSLKRRTLKKKKKRQKNTHLMASRRIESIRELG